MSLEETPAVPPPALRRAALRAAGRVFEVARNAWLAERDRWALWLPVVAGGGILLHLEMPFRPNPWLLPVVLAGLGLALFGARHRPYLFPLLLVLAFLGAGFTAMGLRESLVAAPMLERRLDMALIEGDVVLVEPLTEEGMRAVLERLVVHNRELDAIPERVRLRLPDKSPAVRPGQRIRLYASLMPPGGPAYPGGFDFARHAWFQKLGAIGFGMGKVEIVGETAKDASLGFRASQWMADLRLAIAKRILEGLEGDSGAVSAALITGGERAISRPLLEAYRESGLAHLLSVSGLHMSLVAGLVFVGLRALLALCGPLALRYPIKKWTAFGAAGVTLFYLFLSGAMVPTQRSFLMTGIVLLGVVLDRQAISMRLVTWAALAILLTQPESLLGASFQMSFAAVLALVALYEVLQGRTLVWRRQGGWWRGVALYVAMLALSSLAAGLATAPFSIENFNRFNPYGLVSNMIAVPLSGVLVMPAALASVLLMPLGWEKLALVPMGIGVDLINAVAYEVASWPGAGLALPSFSSVGYAFLLLGGLWLLLMRGGWRWLGLGGILFGFSTSAFWTPPDLLVDARQGMLAVRFEDGSMAMTPGRNDPIMREAWRRHMALSGEWPPLLHGAGGGRVACDGLGCRMVLKSVPLALAARPESLAEDCAAPVLLVTLGFSPPRGACREAVAVIDGRFSFENGPAALWLKEGRIVRVETVAETRGDHPWIMRRDPIRKSETVLIPQAKPEQAKPEQAKPEQAKLEQAKLEAEWDGEAP